MLTLKRKTVRTTFEEVSVASALSDVPEGELSIRKMADKYNLKPAILQHIIIRKKQHGEVVTFSSKYSSPQVFTIEHEKQLNEYIKNVSKCIMDFL